MEINAHVSNPLGIQQRNSSICHLFEEQVERRSGHLAVVLGEQQLTYGELNERANKLARTLRAEGVQPDQPVGIMADRSLAMIVGLLAILKAGGAYMPIDPGYPEARIHYMLEDSGAKLLLTQDHLGYPAFLGNTLNLNDSQVYHRDGSNLEPVAGTHDLAYVIYTSGSTGMPKGVMVEHRNVIGLVKNCNYIALDETTRILQTGAVVFDASTFEIWGALLNGGRLYLVNHEVLLNPEQLKETIDACGITTMFLTTPLFNQLTQQDSRLFSGLKTLLVGGETLSVKLINRVLRNLPDLELMSVYGPTENTTFSTAYRIEGEQSGSIPIGRPINGSAVYVVDPGMNIVHAGGWGELLLGGEGVARGYLNQPELTAERFIASPFRSGERCYRTGDWGRWRTDGTLEFKGRIDRQVKMNGYRIELEEIEAQLAAVESVREAVALVREERGEKQLCAYYVADRELTASELRAALEHQMPAYMMPSYLVQLEKFPLTINGKVDREALPLPEESWQTAAEPDTPATELEARLVNIWQEVLAVPSLSVLDRFLDLGGHSLKALTLMSRMKRAGCPVTLSEIYHYQSIRALAAHLQSVQQEEEAGLIESKEALLSWLRRETKGKYELSSYPVRDVFGEMNHWHVLYSDDVERDRVDRLVQMMRGRVARHLLPHYIVSLQRQFEADPGETMDEDAFCRRLGVEEVDAEEVNAIRARLEADYEQVDRQIRSGEVTQEYPLGAIQQMQIRFHTQPSIVSFKLDEYVDVELLDQSYARLVEQQGLLRSVAVQGEVCLNWREYAFPAASMPRLCLIDVSESGSCGLFMGMLRDVLQHTRYHPERILHQMFVIKRNLREHVVIGLLHHAICDRVTTEIVERQLVSCYRHLLLHQARPSEEVKPFADYVKQVQRGPQRISEQELISTYELGAFHRSKRDALQRLEHRTSDESLSFSVALPTREQSMGHALSIYTKGLQTYLGMEHFPLLFLYDGRRYEQYTYYNTVGECIDFVPLFMDAGWQPDQIMRSANARLELLKERNLNFMHLLIDPTCRYDWSGVKRYVQFGEQFEHLDMFMFNYMGNRVKGAVQDNYDDTVVQQPNPLPLQSLFNCIAASYEDGFIFSFRCSYTIDVGEVREAFLKAACEI
ncbi:amino acid adenylation domain-containing protein [Paenibacillus sp. SYP-B4298]|uniref:amino acid adenylation domain-containing protein n=1 Tax=Paenibacillus sp. SYP-B4298 TaxID=2996034 RepID=UPI0022DD917D|nr:amino acid adenylation domain-containing protein [Paenibacillus sp. SYP-B4298]